MFEELDTRNIEIIIKTLEELHPYIFVYANI